MKINKFRSIATNAVEFESSTNKTNSLLLKWVFDHFFVISVSYTPNLILQWQYERS